jgi:acetyltransferase-like isoleucine patch superfamily enzyme
MNKSVPVEKNIFFDTNRLKYLGKNVIIGKTVRIRQPEKVSIGDNTIIDDFTYISCAMEIGKNCHIASNVSISGGTGKLVIGNYSTISSGCSVHCASSDYRSCSLDLPSVPTHQQFGGIVGDIKIGDYVVIGAHSCILPGCHIPDGAAFGAYTLVKKNNYILPYHLYVGHKCKDLGERENKNLLKELK